MNSATNPQNNNHKTTRIPSGIFRACIVRSAIARSSGRERWIRSTEHTRE